MRKNNFLKFAIIALVTTSLFGITFLQLTSNSPNHHCPVSMMASVECPKTGGQTSWYLHHIFGFYGMTNVALLGTTILAFVAISFTSFFIYGFLRLIVLSKKPLLIWYEWFFPEQRIKLYRWLRLQNKPDSYIFARTF